MSAVSLALRASGKCAALVILCLALQSCDSLFGQKGKSTAQKPKPAKTYDASGFLHHLSMAKLTLDTTPLNASATDLDVLKNYTAGKIKPKSQSVVVLSYKTKNSGGTQKLIVPVTLSPKPGFSSLQEVMGRLEDATLHDVDIGSVSVAPPAKFKPSDDNAHTRAWVDGEYSRMLGGLRKLGAVEETRASLALTSFCIDQRYRDMAYLAVDNAKQTLARAVQEKAADEATLQALSKELEATEKRLHEALPFTL